MLTWLARKNQNILTPQPCLHTLMQTLLSANQSMRTILVISRDDVVSQRLKFRSEFLSFSWESKIGLFFLTFPYPVPVPKNCVIFIGFLFTCKSGWIAQAEKGYCVSKEGKSRLTSQRRTKSQDCALDLTAQDLASGDWKYCLGGPAGRFTSFGFLIYSQKARMSRIYYLRNRSSLGGFAA